MTYQSIRFATEGAVATIVLARPDKLNALTPDMADEIRDALGRTGPNHDGARCVLIMGEGKAFCSGADLSAVLAGGSAGDGAGDGAHRALTGHYHPLLEAIVAHDLPVIAAVQGAAAGIGCSLALACDFCIAGNDAYFLQAFVNIGLVPDGGASWLLPRLVGRARAAEMLMLGEKVPAERAVEWGLVHRNVAADMLEEAAQEFAQRLAAGPTKALGAMKRNLAFAFDHGFAETMQAEADAQRDAAATHDAGEGIAAFLTRRTPEFRGE